MLILWRAGLLSEDQHVIRVVLLLLHMQHWWLPVLVVPTSTSIGCSSRFLCGICECACFAVGMLATASRQVLQRTAAGRTQGTGALCWVVPTTPHAGCSSLCLCGTCECVCLLFVRATASWQVQPCRAHWTAAVGPHDLAGCCTVLTVVETGADGMLGFVNQLQLHLAEVMARQNDRLAHINSCPAQECAGLPDTECAGKCMGASGLKRNRQGCWYNSGCCQGLSAHLFGCTQCFGACSG